MLKKILAIVLIGSATCPALAAVQTWNYSGSSIEGGTAVNRLSNAGNYIELNSNGVNLTTTAWSDTLGTTNINNNPPETIEAAELRFYSGTLGIVNQDEDTGAPNHSIDSYDPNNNPSWGHDYDMVLLEFDSAVSISSFSLGWAQENGSSYADVSLAAYTGDINSYNGIAGETWSSLVNGGGWTSEENFSNVDDYSTVNYQSTNTSQYWLIGAYNSVFGSDNWSTLNDGFKLAALTTSTIDNSPGNEVPEPSTLVMLMSGLLALAAKRKKTAC